MRTLLLALALLGVVVAAAPAQASFTCVPSAPPVMVCTDPGPPPITCVYVIVPQLSAVYCV
jgi:hypothetical protein